MTHLVNNHPFDRLRVGDSECTRRKVAHADIQSFISLAGDMLATSVDRELAADADFRAGLSTGGLASGPLIAMVVAKLPGPGTQMRSWRFETHNAMAQGDVMLAEVRVADLDEGTHSVTLECTCKREDATPIITGQITAQAPRDEISRPFGRPVALGADTAPDRFERIEEMGTRRARSAWRS